MQLKEMIFYISRFKRNGYFITVTANLESLRKCFSSVNIQVLIIFCQFIGIHEAFNLMFILPGVDFFL